MDTNPSAPTPLTSTLPNFLSKPHTKSTGSNSSTSSTNSPRDAYKARRQRAQQQKTNQGRALRMTAAVGPNGEPIEVCVDVALERVTQRRKPKVMSDEEVAQLLALSNPSSPSQGPSQGTKKAVLSKPLEYALPSKTDVVSPKLDVVKKHAVKTISDSQVETMLQQTSLHK
jgi:hypothetical protein